MRKDLKYLYTWQNGVDTHLKLVFHESKAELCNWTGKSFYF